MGTDYWAVKAGGEVIGGLQKKAAATPGNGVLAYFTVPSVKEGKSVISKAGGKLIGDNVEIGSDHGYFQLFTDLDGNTLALWSKTP